MYESFPGGGHNSHQSTSQWTGGPTQEAGSSASLVIAKPDSIKNDTPSEVSDFLPRQRSCFMLTGLAIVKHPYSPELPAQAH